MLIEMQESEIDDAHDDQVSVIFVSLDGSSLISCPYLLIVIEEVQTIAFGIQMQINMYYLFFIMGLKIWTWWETTNGESDKSREMLYERWKAGEMRIERVMAAVEIMIDHR